MLRRAFLDQAIGYELNPVGAFDLTVEQFVDLRDRLPAWYRERVHPHVRQSIDAGQPVLALSDFGYVITGYDGAVDQPPVFGRCGCDTQGRQDRAREWPWAALILGRRSEPLATRVADLAALRYAVALARDQAGPFELPWRNRRFTGQKAFAAWAALLRNAAEPVEDRHHANMKLRLSDSRQAAVRYLDDLAGGQTGAAAAALRAAADAYRRSLELLGQVQPEGLAVSQDGRHAVADLVDRVAAQELEAAVALEKAVTAMAVWHDGGTTWIEVPGFSPGQYASSVHGSQARILQTLGEPLTYEDLICYSGFAFRVGVHEGFCPSAGHPCCGYMCLDGSQRALPWNTRLYEAGPWTKEKPDRATFEAEVRAAVKASIDRGIPVHYGSEEDGLIIGYGDEGRRWLCVHPYHKGGQERFWHDEAKGFAGGQWPWGIVVWTGPKPADQRPTERELTVAALRQAVDMWQTGKRDDYFCGEAAYAHWLNWLREVEAGTAKDPKAGMQGNGWCIDVLVHSRRIAGPWLRAKAELFPGEAHEQLLRAADHYMQTAALCMEGLNCPWDLTLGPEKLGQWTSALRQEEIRRLEAAREHDRAAIAAIGKALALAGPRP
jgi:hypothetical protein